MTTPAPLPQVSLSTVNWQSYHWTHKGGNDDRYDLDSQYQRGSVWTLEQRQALIKSLVMGIPVGAVIVATGWPSAEGVPLGRVVDGKQRIEAVRAFHQGEFAVPGWWFKPEDLDESKRGQNVTIDDLGDRGRRGMESAPLPAMEFDSYRMHVGWEMRPSSIGRPEPERCAVWAYRTLDEMIGYEAEVYALVNAGGTPQTAEDLARAAAIAAGGDR